MFNRNSKKARVIAGIIIVVLVLALILPLMLSVRAAQNAGLSVTVRSGVTLDGENVSGWSRERLDAKANEILEKMRQSTITIEGISEDQKVSATAGSLGLTWGNPQVIDDVLYCGKGPNLIARYKQNKDIERNGANYNIQAEFDEGTLRNFIVNNCSGYDKPMVEATVTRENGQFQIVDGQTGYEVDVDASVKQIHDFLNQEWAGGDIELPLVVNVIEPEGNAEELSRMTALLGTFTTYYSSSGAERCTNIANGCSLISGATVYPGQEFSVLKHLVPFTEENGYQLAGSYLGDEVVESLGGGICQVSTTLYNAVIRAELQVTARSNHSMIVGYVEPSADAAIAESAGMDFRFVNNLKYPVFIEGSTYNKSITFNIYGVETRPEGRKISFESETLTETPTEGVRVKEDAAQPVGYVKSAAGHTGYTAQLWKVVSQDGQEVSREVFNKSTYNMTPMIITVGTAGVVTDELKAAIESEDLEQIKTAAENAKREAEANQQAADLSEAAQAAAQEAYQKALAEGMDTNSAMEAAQQAANAVLANAGGDAQAPAEAAPQENAEGTPEQTPAPEEGAAPSEEAPAPAETAPAPAETEQAPTDSGFDDAAVEDVLQAAEQGTAQ